MNIMQYDPYQWFHLLAPLAWFVGIGNFVLAFTLHKQVKPRINRTISIMGYTGILIGYWLMHHAVLSVTTISSMMHFADVGWLFLAPAIVLTFSSLIWRLCQKKNPVTAKILCVVWKTLSTVGFILRNVFGVFAIFALKAVAEMDFSTPIEEEGNPYSNSLKRPFTLSGLFPNDWEPDCDWRDE